MSRSRGLGIDGSEALLSWSRTERNDAARETICLRHWSLDKSVLRAYCSILDGVSHLLDRAGRLQFALSLESAGLRQHPTQSSSPLLLGPRIHQAGEAEREYANDAAEHQSALEELSTIRGFDGPQRVSTRHPDLLMPGRRHERAAKLTEATALTRWTRLVS